MPTLQQPEAYIGNAASVFDDHGNLAVSATKDFATKLMTAFAAWVEKHVG